MSQSYRISSSVLHMYSLPRQDNTRKIVAHREISEKTGRPSRATSLRPRRTYKRSIRRSTRAAKETATLYGLRKPLPNCHMIQQNTGGKPQT